MRKKNMLVVTLILLTVLSGPLSAVFKSISVVSELITISTSSSTDMSGRISTNTTWTLAGSPYIVVGDVIVETDVFLTIEPGVVVKFINGTNLIIDGALIAQGNSTHRIKFTSNATTPKPRDWGTINFRDTSIDKACIIDWAIIEYASAGITIYNSSPKIDNSILRYNADGLYSESYSVARISNSAILNNTNGIRGSFATTYYYYEPGPRSNISNSRISNNSYGVNLYGGNLMIQQSIVSNNTYGISSSSYNPVEIRESTILKNTYGIWATYGGTFKILGSNISYNTNGIIAPSATISKSIISNNNGVGVSPYYYRYGNTTYYYDGTFSITYSTITENKENGIVSKGSSIIHFSNLYNNTPYDAYNVAPFSWSYGDVNATNNWWGTTNTTEIDEKIYDYYDNFDLKKVFYKPILDSSVTIPPIAHDLAITNVTASPTSISAGQSVYITVNVVNQGDFDERVAVTARYDSVRIGNWTYMYGLLAPGASTTASFYWYTSGVHTGNYTISAEVDVVPGETDVEDNTFNDGVVRVTGPPPSPPYAYFNYYPYSPSVGQNVTFDASMSYDSDGTIVSYAWDFGDDNTGTGRTVSHVYTTGGNYTVTLTVTDNDGLSATTTHSVTVYAPTHDIAVSSMWVSSTYVYVGDTVWGEVGVYNQGTVFETFDVYVFADTNATVIGDEITIAVFTGVSLSYGSSRYFYFEWRTAGVETGTYTISARVPPVLGEVDTADNLLIGPVVTVALRPPMAYFTWQPQTPYVGDTVVFNASASYDLDGTIVSFYWNFGDGNTANATEPIIEHAYNQAKNYSVTLTVTDNDGLTNTAMGTITVIHRVLAVKVTGEFDYLRMEPVSIRLAALVKDAKTMEPFSNALVTVEIYDPVGNLWLSAQMQEKISGSGIYEWTSAGTIGQLKLSKGVYLVRAGASFRGGPTAYDISLFHIDPPAEGNNETLYYVAFTVIALASTTGLIIKRRQIFQRLRQVNRHS